MSISKLMLGLIAVCMLVALPACRSGSESKNDSSSAVPPDERPVGGSAETKAAAPQVVIETTMGKIVLELDAERTPATVKNFLQYVDDKFYDNTIFHRVIKNFMIQGGGFDTDRNEKATRPPITNESLKGRSNLRGTIAMARTNDPNSATAQFFINHRDNKQLDTMGGGYCAFGQVIEGMDVVDRIATAETHNMGGAFTDIPVLQVAIQSIRRK